MNKVNKSMADELVYLPPNKANDYNTSSRVKVKSSLESHGNMVLEN